MRWRSSAALALAAVSLAACAGDRPKRGFRPAADVPVRIGAPYRAGGRTWVPADDRAYDVVGLASWYGAGHAGRPTANGERFDPGRISAAHATLPLPSYVEVTALGSGRTILVRINDRGPFVAGRIIDLSAAAAQALGIRVQGVARVRVRRVDPPEADRAALRAGRPAPARENATATPLAEPRTASISAIRDVPASLPSTERGTGEALVHPPEEQRRYAIPACVRSEAGRAGCWYVEVALLDDPDRADALAAAVAGIAPARVTIAGATYRVRLDASATQTEAQAMLERLARAGYHDARILRESVEEQEHR